MNHKQQPIRLLAETAKSVTLRRVDFAVLIGELEAAEDQIALLEHQLAMAKGAASRPLAADEAECLIAGESPVRIWREKQGLNQRELAVAAEISQSHLAEIETRATTGSVETLRRLARALKVDLDTLVPIREGHWYVR
jgi:ribosome-binding protein aMBF1 (putative translation factor)